MQKISTMRVTSQIIWGLKQPFSINSVHFVQPVQPVQPVHSENSVQPVFSITGSNSCRRRRTLWRRLYFIHQARAHNTCSDDMEDTHKV